MFLSQMYIVLNRTNFMVSLLKIAHIVDKSEKSHNKCWNFYLYACRTHGRAGHGSAAALNGCVQVFAKILRARIGR